jgi:hypothetical protein
MVAFKVLVPTWPTMDRPGKVASPLSAVLVAVPEIVAPVILKEIEELFAVTTLLLASKTRTTTSDTNEVAFVALAGATN